MKSGAKVEKQNDTSAFKKGILGWVIQNYCHTWITEALKNRISYHLAGQRCGCATAENKHKKSL
ncbi:MAG: hypothetical protein ACR2K1_13365 [Saprospiraceae bacterium]